MYCWRKWPNLFCHPITFDNIWLNHVCIPSFLSLAHVTSCYSPSVSAAYSPLLLFTKPPITLPPVFYTPFFPNSKSLTGRQLFNLFELASLHREQRNWPVTASNPFSVAAWSAPVTDSQTDRRTDGQRWLSQDQGGEALSNW